MSKQPGSDAWSDAWSAHYETPAEGSPRRRRLPRLRRRGSGSSRSGRYAVLAAVVIAVVAAPFAVAASTGRFTSNDSRYTVLARNTNNGDGGSIAAACTSNANTTTVAHEPCLDMVNKGTGFAAAFRTRGVQGFRLQTSGSGEATPFVLDKNATGKVTYLNADLLDGKDSTEIGREPWALVSDPGTNASAPTLARGYRATGLNRSATGVYQVTFADDVSNCSYQVTPASQTTARIVSAAAVPGQANQVEVRVRDGSSNGGSDQTTGDPVSDSFQIAVHC